MRSIWCGKAVALAALIVGGTASGGDPPAAWKYVVPAPSEPFEHCPAREIRLSSTVPSEFDANVAFRGKEHRFGELRYGTPNAPPVVVAVDVLSDDSADLYVDVNRNGRFEAKERFDARNTRRGGEAIRIPLGAATKANNIVSTEARTVVFWVGRSGKALRYATAGGFVGEVELKGRKVACWRTDDDGDGFVNSLEDQIWLDLDHDGKWDPFFERFPSQPILQLGKDRFAVHTSLSSAGCSLERIDGEGAVSFELPKPGGRPLPVREVSVRLVGKDGAAVVMTSAGASHPAPIGDYRVYMVTLLLADEKGGEPWYYHFEPAFQSKTPLRWQKVERGGRTLFKPLDGLKFDVFLSDVKSRSVKAGSSISVQPVFTNIDGLILKICCRGSVWDNQKASKATVEFLSGKKFDEELVGFA